MGSGNWIVDNLNSALQTWNDKLAEIWTLISTTPEDFKGGGIWNVIVSINGYPVCAGSGGSDLWYGTDERPVPNSPGCSIYHHGRIRHDCHVAHQTPRGTHYRH